MKTASIRLLYFSPTKTTKTVVEAIARGVGALTANHTDFTDPQSATQNHEPVRGELAVLAAPVYAGRLPADAVARFRRIRGENAPAVVVVVYGNRAYEDALLELRDLAQAQGFAPVAAGAFIGEHSYSTPARPLAVGRPDGDDLDRAKAFGRAVRDKLAAMADPCGGDPVGVPGNFPYKDVVMHAGVAPVTDREACTLCGACAPVCPTAAITVADAVATRAGACIRCCACIRACPELARAMADPRLETVTQWLAANCRERKTPETYL